MMDLDILLFARLGNGKSLASAAREMRISAPMASRRLARLEARLGVKLVHRTTRRLEFTPQGERFHREMTDLLAGWRDAEARLIQMTRTISGPIRISAPTSFGRLYVAPALKEFLDRHADVEARLDLTDAVVDLVSDRIDLAVRITAEIPPDLVAVRLAGNRRILCAAPSYLNLHGTPRDIDALGHHKLLAADGQLPWRLLMNGRSVTVIGQSHVRTNSSEVARELAIAGVGIALRSLWDVHEELESGQLYPVIPDAEGLQDVAIYAVRQSGTLATAVVEAFTAHLLASMQPIAPWERHAKRRSMVDRPDSDREVKD